MPWWMCEIQLVNNIKCANSFLSCRGFVFFSGSYVHPWNGSVFPLMILSWCGCESSGAQLFSCPSDKTRRVDVWVVALKNTKQLIMTFISKKRLQRKEDFSRLTLQHTSFLEDPQKVGDWDFEGKMRHDFLRKFVSSAVQYGGGAPSKIKFAVHLKQKRHKNQQRKQNNRLCGLDWGGREDMTLVLDQLSLHRNLYRIKRKTYASWSTLWMTNSQEAGG